MLDRESYALARAKLAAIAAEMPERFTLKRGAGGGELYDEYLVAQIPRDQAQAEGVAMVALALATGGNLSLHPWGDVVDFSLQITREHAPICAACGAEAP